MVAPSEPGMPRPPQCAASPNFKCYPSQSILGTVARRLRRAAKFVPRAFAEQQLRYECNNNCCQPVPEAKENSRPAFRTIIIYYMHYYAAGPNCELFCTFVSECPCFLGGILSTADVPGRLPKAGLRLRGKQGLKAQTAEHCGRSEKDYKVCCDEGDVILICELGTQVERHPPLLV